MTGNKKVICVMANEKAENLEFMKVLVEAGRFSSIVDQCFPMEQADRAHAYVESGHRRGSVVIRVLTVNENAHH